MSNKQDTEDSLSISKTFLSRYYWIIWFGLTIVGPSNLLLLNAIQNHSRSTIDITLYGKVHLMNWLKQLKCNYYWLIFGIGVLQNWLSKWMLQQLIPVDPRSLRSNQPFKTGLLPWTKWLGSWKPLFASHWCALLTLWIHKKVWPF